MKENWNILIKNASDLEKDLLVQEVMKLRRQCEKMYDVLKSAHTEMLDVYETPVKELPERLEKMYQTTKSVGIIMGHIDYAQKF